MTSFKHLVKGMGVLALLAVPHVLLLSSLLFNTHAFADGDAALQMYPAAYSLKTALMNGESFAWNPHILTGFPMAASFVGGFFSPLYQFLFRSFDIFTVYHWLTLFNFVITAWLTYLLCRLLKLNTLSSLFAGIAFPLATAYWLFGSNLTVTAGFPLIPGLLVAILSFNRAAKPISKITLTLFSGGLLGLLLLQTHPQWPIIAMMLAIGFVMFIDIQKKSSSLLSSQTLDNPSPKDLSDPETNKKTKRAFDFGFLFSGFRVKAQNDEKKSLSLVIFHSFKTLITSIRTTYWTLLTFLIGIAISLPQLLASTRIGAFSARGGGIDFSSASSGTLLPADFLSFTLPNLNVPFIMQKPYLLYLGAAPLLLIILSFALPKPKYYRFFAWTFILCLLIAIKYSPLFWLIHQLPILNAFREPSRFMYVGLFAMVMMAASGFEQLMKLDAVQLFRVSAMSKWLIRLSIGVASLSAFASISVFIWRNQLLESITSYFDSHIYASTNKLPLEHYHNIISGMFDQITDGVTFNNVPTAVGILSLLLGSLLISWYVKKMSLRGVRATKQSSDVYLELSRQTTTHPSHLLSQERGRDSKIASQTSNDNITMAFSVGIIILTLLNGIGVKIETLHTVPQSLITTPPASAQIIQRNPQVPYRVFSFLPGASVYQELDSKFGYHPEDNIEALKNLLSPNLNLFYQIDSFDYYDDLMDRRTARLLAYLGSNRATFGESLADMDIPFEEKKHLFLDRLPLLSLANVKYITSLYLLDHPRLKLINELRVTSYELQVYVYENLDIMPRYYLAYDVKIDLALPEEESWQNLLKQKTVNKKQSTLIECDDCQDGGTPPLSPPLTKGGLRGVNTIAAATPTSQTNTSYIFNIESDSNQWFVFGQNNLPGWSATIDGQSTQIYRANFIFQAIRVPKGNHVIEWKYTLPNSLSR